MAWGCLRPLWWIMLGAMLEGTACGGRVPTRACLLRCRMQGKTARHSECSDRVCVWGGGGWLVWNRCWSCGPLGAGRDSLQGQGANEGVLIATSDARQDGAPFQRAVNVGAQLREGMLQGQRFRGEVGGRAADAVMLSASAGWNTAQERTRYRSHEGCGLQRGMRVMPRGAA